MTPSSETFSLMTILPIVCPLCSADVLDETQRPLKWNGRHCIHTLSPPRGACAAARSISASVGSSNSNDPRSISPGSLVRVDRDAGARDRAVDQLHSAGDRARAEEPLALAEHQGKDPEPVLVDQVVLEQGLDQAHAAVNLDLRPVWRLSSATYSATSPMISVELFQSAPSSVLEATCLRVLLS